jgi:hypothetical protein
MLPPLIRSSIVLALLELAVLGCSGASSSTDATTGDGSAVSDVVVVADMSLPTDAAATPSNDGAAACGQLGQACCENFTCLAPGLGCRPGISASPPGTCSICGGLDQICCPADGGPGSCSPGLTCKPTVDQGAFCRAP